MLTKHLIEPNRQDLATIWQDAQAQQTEFLDLSRNSFTHLDFGSSPILESLKVIDASYNKQTIQEVVLDGGKFPHLQHVYLYKSNIQRIVFKGTFPHLETLHLANNQLTEFVFPDGSFPKLQTLYLYQNPIRNIDPEFFDKEQVNVWEDVRNVFVASQEGEVVQTQAKLVWVGNSRAGKTTLSHQLRKNEFKKFVSSDDIRIRNWEIPFAKLSEDLQNKIEAEVKQINKKFPQNPIQKPQNIEVKMWDFAGQEYYHATHRLFLTSNVLYVLMWETATNRQKEHEDDPLAPQDFPKSYWQHSINYYAPDNTTITVQNKVEGKCEIDPENRLYKVANREEQNPRRYDQDIEDLEEAIIEQLGELPHLGKPVPKVYEEIRTKLKEKAESTPFLTFEDYQKFCQKHDSTSKKIMQDESHIATMTKLFHETGSLICYRDETKIASAKLKEHVFIDPKYVTGTIYNILSRSVKNENGEFDKAHVETIVQSTQIDADTWLALMKHFELIFEIEREDKTYFVAPQYLAKECQNPEQLKWAKKGSKLQHVFTLSYPDFMPNSNFLRFMSKYGHLHKDYLYWKEGLVFEFKEHMIFAECRQTPEERTISVSVGDGNREIGRELFEALYDIDPNENLQISVNNVDFIRIKDLLNYPAHVSHIPSINEKLLDLKDFDFLLGHIRSEVKLQGRDESGRLRVDVNVIIDPEAHKKTEQTIREVGEKLGDKLDHLKGNVGVANEKLDAVDQKVDVANLKLDQIQLDLAAINKSIDETNFETNPQDKADAEALLQRIMSKLEEQGKKAELLQIEQQHGIGGKLKASIPLIPGFLSYEFEVKNFDIKTRFQHWKKFLNILL